MSVILGLRDTGDFPTDEREMDWDTVIMRRYPRSEQKAPLTALMAGMKKKATTDPQYNWFDKNSPLRHSAVNYSTGYNTTATTLVVDSSAPFRKDDLIRNAATDEVMRIAADPTDTTQIVVARGWGSTPAAITDNDTLFACSRAVAEGAKSGSALFTDPSKLYNFTQIVREPVKLTGTGRATAMRTGNPWKEQRQDALDSFNIDRERNFIHGVRNEDLTGDEPVRSAGGIRYFLSTNVSSVADGNLTWDAWMTFLMNIFKYGSGEKLCFCGNKFLKVLMDMIDDHSQLNMTSGADVYGVKVTRWVTPYGEVYFKNHPLFNEITEHTKAGLFVEPRYITRRFLSANNENRDVKYLPNRQDNDEDAQKDEYLVEEGLQVHMEAAHGWLDNVDAYSTA